MTTTTINVADMHCSSCTGKIVAALKRNSNIHSVMVNPLKRDVFVTHNPETAAYEIIESISQLGFKPALLDVFNQPSQADGKLLKRLGVAGICMMQVMMLQIALYAGLFQDMTASMQHLIGFAALTFTIPVLTYSAVPFFINGFGNIPRHGINMDTPIALAILIAFLVSLTHLLQGSGEVYFDSVTMFTFLLLGARYLDQRLRGKLQLEDQLLANLPRFVTRVSPSDQAHEQVLLAEINVGETVWVSEGEMIPLDGLLRSKRGQIDTTLLTGEVEPRTVEYGQPLFAGTLNRGAAITMQSTSPPSASRVAEINTMANQAAALKDESQGIADRVARVFIPSILVIAAITFALWMLQDPSMAISATLAVLVVSCPCALSLAAPAAKVAATTRLRHQGLLVRNSHVFEHLLNIDEVFFDKTGTLTEPKPKISNIRLVGSEDEQTCLSMACALELYSTHPLAHAFKKIPNTWPIIANGIIAEDVTVAHGAGISGTIRGRVVRIGSAEFCGFESPPQNSPSKSVHLSIAGVPTAIFYVSTEMRADAHQTVDAMRQAGLRVSMLSGDHQDSCERTANSLGIEYTHEADPESKRDLLLSSDNCLFVGDGLNDLPALSTASVSAATVETVDLVKSKADVLLLTPRLLSLLGLFTTARRVQRITRQNYTWAVVYNLLAIPCAAAGLASPLIAAVGMSVSSLLVMLNAGRLLKSVEI